MRPDAYSLDKFYNLIERNKILLEKNQGYHGTFGQGPDYLTENDKIIIAQQNKVMQDVSSILHPDPEIERARIAKNKANSEAEIKKYAIYWAKYILLFMAAVIAFSLTSCRTLDERNEECIENMPIEVQGYVKDFLEEGKKRGRKIKLGRLRIFLTTEYIKSKNGNQSNAQTNTLKKTITIDISTWKWKNYPKSIVFHELGHAVLGKNHSDNEADIMNKEAPLVITSEALDTLFSR